MPHAENRIHMQRDEMATNRSGERDSRASPAPDRRQQGCAVHGRGLGRVVRTARDEATLWPPSRRSEPPLPKVGLLARLGRSPSSQRPAPVLEAACVPRDGALASTRTAPSGWAATSSPEDAASEAQPTTSGCWPSGRRRRCLKYGDLLQAASATSWYVAGSRARASPNTTATRLQRALRDGPRLLCDRHVCGKWHERHAAPCAQPFGPCRNRQAWHLPMTCPSEPTDQRPSSWPNVAPSTRVMCSHRSASRMPLLAACGHCDR